jgi:multicomponent K+:H+ antiporter subunit D
MSTLRASLMPHLIAAPILLPMATAALMLLLGDARRPLKAWSACCRARWGWRRRRAAAVGAARRRPHAVGVYLPGNWPAPYGIALVVDRLSAMMLLLTSVLGLAAVLYSVARWDRAGVHFHPLFQLQLMGLAGAFLTADLFNLFVFFEILLAASYGLLLHGSGGRACAGAALHRHQPDGLDAVPDRRGHAVRRDRHAQHGRHGHHRAGHRRHRPRPAARRRGGAGGGLSGQGRGLAAELLAALHLRQRVDAGGGAVRHPDQGGRLRRAAGVDGAVRPRRRRVGPVRRPGLVGIGMVTLALGAIGMLATQHLGRMVAFCAIVSSGTLLAALGFGQPAVTGGALYYLLGSTLAVAPSSCWPS